jgi:F-type H+-transporting ATPase subunit alpha
MKPDAGGPGASLLSRQRRAVDGYALRLRLAEHGRVVSLGDGVAWIEGLPSAAMDEHLLLADGSEALVFQLDRDRVGAILLRQTGRLTAGTAVRLTGRTLTAPAGDALLGRVIDPLGLPLDGLPAPDPGTTSDSEGEGLLRVPLDSASPPIVARDFVREPLYTGSKIVDTLVPIGKGQRQLIIGDDGTGKSTLAVDAVLAQRGRGVRCVYVLIGQKRSAVVGTVEALRAGGALPYTTVVVAEATALPGLKHLAPFAGCAVAERWAAQGLDVLLVYDDLTTHVQAYRELALLLQRPPGREAYPADIFFLHARLLERATHLSAAAGGGSISALPLVVTEQGEIAAYIPTNLISITDGQIYLDRDLFAAGVLPAIDVTRSVSRIGGKAQHPRIRQESGRMKLDYLQFLELEVFTRFGTRLDPQMEARLRRGRVLREVLKQDSRAPLPPEAHMAWLVAYNEGLLDRLGPGEVGAALSRLLIGQRAGALTLDDGRALWVEAVQRWLGG